MILIIISFCLKYFILTHKISLTKQSSCFIDGVKIQYLPKLTTSNTFKVLSSAIEQHISPSKLTARSWITPEEYNKEINR